MKLLREFYYQTWTHAILLLVFYSWLYIFSFTPLFSLLSFLLLSPPFPSSFFPPLLPPSFISLFFLPSLSSSIKYVVNPCYVPCIVLAVETCGDKSKTPNLPLTTILYFKLEDLDGNWEIKWKITVLLTIMINKCFLCVDAFLTILIVFSNLSSQQRYETSRTASPLLQKVKLRPWES